MIYQGEPGYIMCVAGCRTGQAVLAYANVSAFAMTFRPAALWLRWAVGRFAFVPPLFYLNVRPLPAPQAPWPFYYVPVPLRDGSFSAMAPLCAP
jgi:hypothetical protein